MDDSIDQSNITAKYADGVLQVSLSIIARKKNPGQEIVIN